MQLKLGLIRPAQCRKADETVGHIVCKCSKLAQRDYKVRHDSVAKAVHWNLCKKYGLECKDKWYEHEPERVRESDELSRSCGT